MAALAAVLALLAVASPARAATPNLSGEWINSSHTLSAYHLQMSADGNTLAVTWRVNIGRLDEGLAGTFKGTLNASGTAFTGPMNVKVGSLSIGGTMTVAITGQEKFGFPLLDLSYEQDNAVSGNVTLEMWLGPPTVSSSSIAFEFHCPAPQPCQGEAEATVGGSTAATAGAAKTGIVGSSHFTIEPGQAHKVTLSLNKTGRNLLAKRRSLNAQVLVLALKQSAKYLPPLEDVSTITFRAR